MTAKRLSSAPLFPLLVLGFASCAAVREPVRRAHPHPEALTAGIAPASAAAAAPAISVPVARFSQPEPAPRVIRSNIAGISVTGVAFDSRSYRLAVIDQAGGPGSRFADAASAAAFTGGLAAINGGFFTPAGAPLGLVVAAGKSAGAWNSASSLGTAVWHENRGGMSAITRRNTLGRTAAASMREALQTGPLLVENGKAVAGLDDEKTSARSLVLWDGASRWMIARTSPCSLADLAQALSDATNLPAYTVLNLDGGRSADLWVSAKINGGPIAQRPFYNKPVRNFLVLQRR
ncbi:MAG: phosphodiester glycosidase family protein [Verrucomicrobiota bacterium]